ALLMFAPVLVWNSEHDWISISKQFGRVDAGAFTARFLGEFLAGQLGLASPIIAGFGVFGLIHIARSKEARRSPAALLLALIVPAMLYFLWHSLRDRVQGNWPSFLYPAFAIAAAIGGMHLRQWSGRTSLGLRASAAPVAGLLLAIIYAQAVW